MAETQDLLRKAEKIAGGPVITYWDSDNGTITDDDVEALRALLNDSPQTERLFLCLTSNGGSGQASLRIAHMLRRYCNRLIVLVPKYAVSAGTMLALAADEIQLAPLAALSPVDTSIKHPLSPVNQDNDQASVGQVELDRIIALWRKESKSDKANPWAELWHHIHPLVIGAVDRANSLSVKLCNALLSYHMQDSDKRKAIAEMLTTAYPTHSYPILLPEAREIGLPVKEMDQDLESVLVMLMNCYYEAGKLLRTDRDENHHHDEEISTIVERSGRMLFFRSEFDWYYREVEKRWNPMNTSQSWFHAEMAGGVMGEVRLYIR